ncbi:MAG: hypothetical protein WC509_06270 [Candidatus Izemoplasmatales bacterium]
METTLKRILIVVMTFLSIAVGARSNVAYSYHDDLDETVAGTVNVGKWSFGSPYEYLDYYVADRFMSFYGVASLADLYADADFQTLMDAVSKTSTGSSTYTGGTYVMTDVEIEGVLWDIEGIRVTTSNNMSLGFLRQIDRTTNGGTPVHRLLPPVATDPLPYAEYSFFSAYDIENARTSNTYGFRLDNEVRMTTAAPVAGFTGLSFYAIRGLRISSSEQLATNRTFYVQISTNGTTWSAVGTTKTLAQLSTGDVYVSGTTRSANFTLYTFNLTSTQIANMPAAGYYVRLFFDGGVSGNNTRGVRSRMVVDDFAVLTNS